MSAQLHYDFDLWLQEAVCGLSADVQAVVAEELQAHYEDMVAEFIEKGETAVSAHQLALKTLGASKETRQGLRDTHLAARRYKTTVVLGFVAMAVMPVGLLGLPTEWVLGMSVFLPLFIAFHTLAFYLRQTYFYDEATRPIRLLLLGGGVSVVVSVLFPLLLDCSIFSGSSCQGGTAVVLTAYGLLYAGVMLAGIALLNLSCVLKALKASSNVLLTGLRYLCFVNGLAILIAAVAVLFQSFGIAVLMVFILIFSLMLTLSALILLFFRAISKEKRFEFTV